MNFDPPPEGFLRDIRAQALCFGVDVNTDDIIPSNNLQNIDIQFLATKAMSGLRPTFYEEVRALGGCILIGGVNFGSGSSREQAVDCLKAARVLAVVADSFRPIFFDNAFNVGLPVLAVPNIRAGVTERDVLHVDIENARVCNETTGRVFEGTALPPVGLAKLRQGGLLGNLRRYILDHGMDRPYESAADYAPRCTPRL